MRNNLPSREQIDQFIVEKIDTVPQLEALLVMWRYRPRQWTVEQMARELYISPELAYVELHHLSNRGLISPAEDSEDLFRLDLTTEDRQSLLAALDETYRRELVRISNLIHAKAPRAMRDFASAFRFKKDEKR